jgi:hypothetical protein
LFITVYQEDLLPLTDACQANGMWDQMAVGKIAELDTYYSCPN